MQSALYKGDYRKKSHNSCTKSTPHSTATRSNQRQLAATQKTQFTNGYVYMENNGFSPHSPRCLRNVSLARNLTQTKTNRRQKTSLPSQEEIRGRPLPNGNNPWRTKTSSRQRIWRQHQSQSLKRQSSIGD